LIEHMALGKLPADRDEVLRYVRRVVKQARFQLKWIKRYDTAPPEPYIASTAMPVQEPERTAEAVRRLLPELRVLNRYERRA
jgi:hypothetical protein